MLLSDVFDDSRRRLDNREKYFKTKYNKVVKKVLNFLSDLSNKSVDLLLCNMVQ